jgi:hypothetical protein
MPEEDSSLNSHWSTSERKSNANTLHQSALDPNLTRDQREPWRLRGGGIHFGLFFLLIDVDRTGSDRPFPTLCSGKHKYGFHACGADPPHLRLRPVLMPRAF